MAGIAGFMHRRGMFGAMRRPSALLFSLLLLSFAGLAGPASADHVYSHRYILWGRVLDADGAPAPNVTVQAGTTGFQSGGACAPFPGSDTDAFPGRDRNVTNALGEFVFCLHTHAIPAGARVRVVATASGASADAPADADLRQSFLLVRLPEPSPQANASARETPTILGRAWVPGPSTLEGVPVRGATAARALVNVTLASPDNPDVLRLTTTTNAYGDFALRAPAPFPPGRGKVTVEIHGQSFNADLHESGATYVRAILSATPPAAATPTSGGATPTPPPAGIPVTGTPAGALQEDGAPTNDAPFAGVLLVAAALAAALVLRRR